MKLQFMLEERIVAIIEGKKRGRAFLFLISLFFRFAVFLRNLFYDLGYFKTYAVSKKVICVGNLVAGGTGKTPIVAALAAHLSQNKGIAILSRGYRSEIEKSGRIEEVTRSMSPRYCGDEPLLLKTQLPHVSLFVGKNRVASAQEACKTCDFILLDDGMQYRRLHKDLTIIVVDSHDLFGKNHFLPRGYLRDHPKKLEKADLIIAHHVQDEKQFKHVEEALGKWTKAPIVGTRLEAISSFQKGNIGVMTAIGKPHHFISLLKSHHLNPVKTFFKPDHLPFEEVELSSFSEEVKRLGGNSLVCTEKDRIKIPEGLRLSLPITSVKTEIKIVYGGEHWYNLLKKIDP